MRKKQVRGCSLRSAVLLFCCFFLVFAAFLASFLSLMMIRRNRDFLDGGEKTAKEMSIRMWMSIRRSKNKREGREGGEDEKRMSRGNL